MATAASIDVILTANTARYRAAMIDAGRITNQQLGGIQRQAAATAQSMQTLNRVAGGFIGFQGLKAVSTELIRIADGFSNVQAKVRLAAGENANMAASFDKLFGVAQRTFNSLEGTAALVQRGSMALQNFGQSADLAFNNSVKLAEIFNKSLVVSGASAENAAAAALQFSQALASGRFQGDEFRSVMENNSRFAQLLADSLGVNIAQLRDLSKEGKLTTQSFLDLLNKTGDLDKQFANMPLTIGRAKTLLDNAFTKFIGEADQARGASRAVAESIAVLANNVGPIVNALGALAVVATGAFGSRAILAAKAYGASLLDQAAAARASEAATRQKAAADAQAAQAILLKARNEVISAEATAAAAVVDRQRIQSVIAMATAQEAMIRANGLRATSEIELARLSQSLTAVEGARVAATLALGEARQAEVRANTQLLVANRALQASYVATGIAGEAAAAKITLGMRAATLAQNAMTLATKAFSGALLLVGGPLGAVLIGLSMMAIGFSNAGAKAEAAAGKFRSAIEAAGAFRDAQTKESALSALGTLLPNREQERQEIARLQRIRNQGSLPAYNTGSVLAPNFQTGSGIDKEIRERTARIAEMTRQIDFVNKKINDNSINWQNNASAIGSTTSKYEEQNKALDKERDQLTAQRLELTKGYRARLEFEAMQQQGVKTAADLDAGTKTRIDALVREHDALKSATDARKAGTKATRDAATAAKQQENQYQSTIDKINQQIALDREAMLVTDKMTAAERLRVVVTNELSSAKNKLSEAEQARVKVLLDEAVAQGKAKAEMDEAVKAAQSMLELQNQLNEAYRSRQVSNGVDLMGMMRGSDQVEQLRRQVDLQEELQRQVESLNEKYSNREQSAAQAAAYKNEIDRVRSHHDSMLAQEEAYQIQRNEIMANGWNGALVAMEDYVANANNVAGQMQTFFSNAFTGLENVISDFISKGKADWKGFVDSLAAEFVRMAVKQQLSKLLQKFLPGVSENSNAGAMQSAASALAASATPLYGAAAALQAAAASLAAAGVANGGTAPTGGTGGGGWLDMFTSILGMFGGGGGGGGGASAVGGSSYLSWMQGGYADGGFTGRGGKYQPAGMVHKGEGVLSQPEVNALGGEAGFNALRRAIRSGYANGGMVGGSGRVRLGRGPEDSAGPGAGRGRAITVEQHFHNPRMYDRSSEAQRAGESAMKLKDGTRFA